MDGSKTNNISVDYDTLQDLIWMSVRYCIGRHTIAASSMPKQLYKVYTDIIQKLNTNGQNNTEHVMKRHANNIRREICDVLRFQPNITIDNDYHNLTTDAYSLIFQAIADKYPEGITANEFKKLSFYIDVLKETCVITDNEDLKSSANTPAFFFYEIDITPWILLANFLDKSTWKHCTIENEEVIIVPTYDVVYKQETERYKIVKRWRNIEWLKNGNDYVYYDNNELNKIFNGNL